MPATAFELDATLIGLRALHFLACMLLFGEALYVVAIEPQARIRPRIMWASIVVALVTALGWLAVEAVGMSGEAPAQALSAHVLALVIEGTQFGHTWIMRACGVVLMGVAVAFVSGARADSARRSGTVVLLLLAGHHLVMLAWMGHAGAGTGSRRAAELAVDALHLLGAGAWLGSLPAFVTALQRAAAPRAAAMVTRRYSYVGIVSVTALVATGIGNAVFRDVDPAALIDSGYGQVLLAKVIVVGLMVALAAVNRSRLTPRLPANDAAALRALRRNARLEIALGIVVIALVGALGIAPPPTPDMAGMHAASHPGF